MFVYVCICVYMKYVRMNICRSMYVSTQGYVPRVTFVISHLLIAVRCVSRSGNSERRRSELGVISWDWFKYIDRNRIIKLLSISHRVVNVSHYLKLSLLCIQKRQSTLSTTYIYTEFNNYPGTIKWSILEQIIEVSHAAENSSCYHCVIFYLKLCTPVVDRDGRRRWIQDK
jgi:hypothetical protein